MCHGRTFPIVLAEIIVVRRRARNPRGSADVGAIMKKLCLFLLLLGAMPAHAQVVANPYWAEWCDGGPTIVA